jgi:hypothetical protein
MKPRTASRLARSLWGLTAGLMVLTLGLLSLNIVDTVDWLYSATNFAAVMGLATFGALIASRRHVNPIGWIFCAMGLVFAISSLAEEYSIRSLVTAPGSLPPSVLAVWLENWLWIVGVAPIILIFLLFPTGRLLSPRWKPVAWIAIVGSAVSAAGFALKPGLLQTSADYGVRFVNPVGLPVLRAGIDEALSISSLVSLAAAFASVLALVMRFRRTRGDERQQIKWLVYVGATAAVFLIVTWAIEPLDDIAFALFYLTMGLGIPAAVGIAVLKYRLYDIDRIINRTLVYGLLTALLVGVYVLAAVGLGAAVRSFTGQEGNSIVIAASTLAVAALFRPARRGIQGLIDRRFYRRKYDASRTLEAFSARLREHVDLDSLTGELLAVVRGTMQPAHASLWLRSSEAPSDTGKDVG